MRLIDANELMKDRFESVPARFAAMFAPTVYDVDKVVERLEAEGVYEDAPLYHGDKEADCYIRLGKAIEIVRSGGA